MGTSSIKNSAVKLIESVIFMGTRIRILKSTYHKKIRMHDIRLLIIENRDLITINALQIYIYVSRNNILKFDGQSFRV